MHGGSLHVPRRVGQAAVDSDHGRVELVHASVVVEPGQGLVGAVPGDAQGHPRRVPVAPGGALELDFVRLWHDQPVVDAGVGLVLVNLPENNDDISVQKGK